MDFANLETINMRTWSAPLQGQRNGWQLRLSGGYSRRANSVYTHNYHGTDLSADIAYCERVYTLHGMHATFRTTKGSQPSNLHDILQEHGYEQSHPSQIKIADLGTFDSTSHDDFLWSSEFSEAWLQRYMQLNQIDPKHYESHTAILQSLPDTVCFGQIGQDAMGLAVIEQSFVAFYDIVVDEAMRGRGYGSALMQSLIHWAKTTGATSGILAVDGTNTIAQRLYDKLGFETQYEYWYWAK